MSNWQCRPNFAPVSACHAVDVNATMPQGAQRSGRGGGGGRGSNKDTSRRPTSGRGTTKARRTSSGGTARCESEASVRARSSTYRKFDSATSNVRCVMIGSLADELIRHQDSHNGRARRGFVEELVTRTNGVAPLLEITRDDINNEVKRRKKKKKEEAKSARAAALSSSGDAATNCVASVGSRVRFPLDTASSREPREILCRCSRQPQAGLRRGKNSLWLIRPIQTARPQRSSREDTER